MAKRIITLVFIIIGGSLGGSYLPYFWEYVGLRDSMVNQSIFNLVIGAIIFYLLSLVLKDTIIRAIKQIETFLSQKSSVYLLFGSVGTLIGLLLAVLFLIPIQSIGVPFINQIMPPVLAILLGYLGFTVATSRVDDWRKLFQSGRKKDSETALLDRKVSDKFHRYKILDTSVIIDGRIYDVAKAGFVDGTLVIPNFVLKELQLIADSSDSLKRARGRRGLDILNDLQKSDAITVESYEGDFEDVPEVDLKLIKLAKLIDGVVVTNDFNLNKVCEFQGVPVLNINELSNAVKPVVIPGETLNIMIIKAGTERNQGVAYLEDGTMIVVEDGQYYMNQKLPVVVTSALQTNAGRMIFARPAHSQNKIKE